MTRIKCLRQWVDKYYTAKSSNIFSALNSINCSSIEQAAWENLSPLKGTANLDLLQSTETSF